MPLSKLQNKFRRLKKSKPNKPSTPKGWDSGIAKTGKLSALMPKAEICRTVTTFASTRPLAVVTVTFGVAIRSYPALANNLSSKTVRDEPVSKTISHQTMPRGLSNRAQNLTSGLVGSNRTQNTQDHLPTFRHKRTSKAGEQFVFASLESGINGFINRFAVGRVKEQDAFFGQPIFVVGSDFDEQPLAFVTLADLFNGFGANFVHLPSPTKIVALKSVQACMSVSVLATKAERLHSHTLARLHTCTLKRKRRDDA
jgi:hypothetical protein